MRVGGRCAWRTNRKRADAVTRPSRLTPSHHLSDSCPSKTNLRRPHRHQHVRLDARRPAVRPVAAKAAATAVYVFPCTFQPSQYMSLRVHVRTDRRYPPTQQRRPCPASAPSSSSAIPTLLDLSSHSRQNVPPHFLAVPALAMNTVGSSTPHLVLPSSAAASRTSIPSCSATPTQVPAASTYASPVRSTCPSLTSFVTARADRAPLRRSRRRASSTYPVSPHDQRSAPAPGMPTLSQKSPCVEQRWTGCRRRRHRETRRACSGSCAQVRGR